MVDFRKNYDVAVAGAGIAGVAAALSAARRGYKVALIEKQTTIGGLATSGLIFIYLPLCDGRGRQVLFGIAEELLKLSMKYSPCDLPPAWGGRPKDAFYGFDHGNRYQVIFSPAGFTLALDEALAAAGVDLWLDTLICSANTSSDGKINSIEVENISGRGEISAGCFIDATGSAALIRYSGGEVESGINYQTPWIMERNDNGSVFSLDSSLGMKIFGSISPDFETGDPLDGYANTVHIRSTWDEARKYYLAAYASGNDRRKHYPVILPGMVQFRKIARIAGMKTLSDGDDGKYFEDSIGLYPDWRRCSCIWETPYGTLLPEKVRGVLAAGRCISTTGDAWEAFRVIPAAAMTGEAAGTAAALALQKHCDPAELSASEVQNELRKQGFLFHIDQ
ncbi:MAG: FAD-dependent oxidoreductase [Lentisphaerae bacterium]|nr:FAD-dependent oxidoreductase [Lentisphaerota bacterium]